MRFHLTPGQLTLADLKQLCDDKTTLQLVPECIDAIIASEKTVREIIAKGRPVYGINTGFGSLANTRIENDKLEELQKSLLLSHAAGTGALLKDEEVRLILALKINSLAQGYSGVRLQTIEALIKLYNARVYPCIPAQGSVGASGDLAPLAHLSIALLGIGKVRHENNMISAEQGLKIAGLEPITLAPKEGLALINGTQVSTALALIHLFAAENIFLHALLTGALTTEAVRASHQPFDERIQKIRRHPTQSRVAEMLRDLLQNSPIEESHRDCGKVQDPYSIRCQPQVMGACLNQILFTAETLTIEANAVSDNPLVFADDQAILSGGNFHAEPVAFAADNLALSIAEIGAISERRIALLMEPAFSRLPAFLVHHAGLNSGFMIAQVTAAALASENKSLAHPGSVDSLPTSANQEDHVSMATYAARRLSTMIENTTGIIAIELLAGCQGIDFLRPLRSTLKIEQIHDFIRKKVPFYEKDRFFAPDIESAKTIICSKMLPIKADLLIF